MRMIPSQERQPTHRSHQARALVALALGLSLSAGGCTALSTGVGFDGPSDGSVTSADGPTGVGNEAGATPDAPSGTGREAGVRRDTGVRREGATADLGVGTGCGTCPSGFTCSPSGVCKSRTGIPHFSHVFVIYEENEAASSIIGSSSAPYINMLASTYGLAASYYAVCHPSLPNYLALTGGSTFGVTTDCLPGACPQSAAEIASELEAAGGTWHAYAESMPSSCYLSDSGNYAPRHNPLVYYTPLRASCAKNDVPYTSFAADLGGTGYDYMSITPNLCDDGHNLCTGTSKVAESDAWLKANVPAILASSEWKNDGVLFIVWDEGAKTTPGCTQSPVVALVISPLAKAAYKSGTMYTHYSMLATIQDGLGVPRLANTTGATPMADFFK